MIELNEIHLGDCLDIMPDIPAGSVDMILCDLPYGITNVACINTNRNYILIEKDVTYFNLAKERLLKTQKPMI